MQYTPYKHYQVRKEWKDWYSEYPLEKCKYSIFYHRLLLGYSYEDAINPNRITKRWKYDKKAMAEKIQSKVGNYKNWYAVITQHKDAIKPVLKSNYDNIVYNKEEAQVIINQYKIMIDQLDNTEWATAQEQNEINKKQIQLNEELKKFLSSNSRTVWQQY